MSVQAGIWNLDGRPIDGTILANMSRAVEKYGPDDDRILILGNVGLLYRPFHTTTSSRIDSQPHASVRGRMITWDGRLDNRDELISQLGTFLSPASSDVAIVTAAYECWGKECFEKLVGDWALSVWDRKERLLILARDYIGVRPLYYYASPIRFMWSSHLETLASFGDSFTLCREYIAGYLTHWPDPELTPYQEIRSVPPGGYLVVTQNKISSNSYWTFRPRRKTRYRTDAEYEEHFNHLFRQSVRRRMHSDSPVLADLSGGMDSSSIVCVADDISTKEGVPQVDTFSFYDRNEPEEDDFTYFVRVEEKRGRIGHHADLAGDGDTFALEYPSFAPTPGLDVRRELKEAYLAIMSHAGHRVVLSGVGGDEMLGQALDPRVQIADLMQRGRFVEMGRLLTAWSPLLRYPWLQLFFQSIELVLPKWIRVTTTLSAKTEPWIDADFARAYRLSDRQLKAAEGKPYWLPSTRDYFQTVRALSRQVTHTFPTIHETRYPYLDQTLVEFLTSLPTDQLLRPGQRRSLMRRTLVNLLPQEILARRTKSGPGRCYVATLEKHWKSVEEILPKMMACELGVLSQPEFITAIVGAKNGNLPRKFLRLLKALSLELWLRDVSFRGIIRGASPSAIHWDGTTGYLSPKSA